MRCDLIAGLEDYLRLWATKEFSYGTADCALFAGGWVHNVTGDDPFFGFAPWDSEEGAAASISQAGFESLADAVSSVLTLRQGALFARRGDIVQIKNGDALGICTGAECAFLLPGRGFVSVPLTVCGRAWSVA